jgi:hypothetical protein
MDLYIACITSEELGSMVLELASEHKIALSWSLYLLDLFPQYIWLMHLIAQFIEYSGCELTALDGGIG